MQLQKQLSKWGYTRNIRRSEALSILREEIGRETIKDQTYIFTLQHRPTRLNEIKRHLERSGKHNLLAMFLTISLLMVA